jgi:peptidoglycan hydrolase CwlO-like protein
MTQLFVQLAQSVTGNVITIVALEIVAAAIGFIIAWLYAKSVYTPVIKGLEADKVALNKQVDALNDEIRDLNVKVNKLKDETSNLNEIISKLNDKLSNLEKEIAKKDK